MNYRPQLKNNFYIRNHYRLGAVFYSLALNATTPIILCILTLLAALFTSPQITHAAAMKNQKKIPLNLLQIQFFGENPGKKGAWVSSAIFVEKPILVTINIRHSSAAVLFTRSGAPFSPGVTDFPDTVNFGVRFFLVNEKGEEIFADPENSKDPLWFDDFKTRFSHVLKGSFTQAYTKSYPYKCKLKVAIYYRLDLAINSTVKDENVRVVEFDIPEIVDSIPPLTLTPSLKKKGQKPFNFSIIGLKPGKNFEATTSGLFYDTTSQKFSSVGIYPNLICPEKVIENSYSHLTAGYLLIRWENLFDNFTFPYNGGKEPFFKKFALILRAEWNEALSHPTLSSLEESVEYQGKIYHIPAKYSVSNWRGEPFFHEASGKMMTLIDQSEATDAKDRKINKETSDNNLGPGFIRLKLPYDRTGTLYYGFYCEDYFGNRHIIMPEKSRYVEIKDDISPGIIVSLKNSPDSHFLTFSNSVSDQSTTNKKSRQFLNPKSLMLQGKPSTSTQFHGEEDVPIHFHLMAFDNIRLSQVSVKVTAQNANNHNSFGFRHFPERIEKNLRNDFVNSFVLTPLDSQIAKENGLHQAVIKTISETGANIRDMQLMFTNQGIYTLNVKATDIFGNSGICQFILNIHDTEFQMKTLNKTGTRNR